MITNEMKDRIFGLYLPCMVQCGKQIGWRYSQKTHPADLRFYIENKDRGLQLLLTPLSEITDEDAIEVSKIVFGDAHPEDLSDGPSKEFSASHGRKIAEEYEQVRLSTGKDWLQIIDFLRSKGYALPYMGIDLFESGIAIPKQ